jgi:plastocyanin
MRIRAVVLTAALLGAPVLGGGAIDATLPASPGVNIDNFSFAPDALVVAPGIKVTWTNRDDIPHTVTDAAGQRSFRSADTPGTYHYFCSLHPHMQGTVIVK